jgi:hypothetical protein
MPIVAYLTSSCARPRHVRDGSWLCKNAKKLNRDRRSYSSKTALVAQLASEFNLEVELRNIILVAFRFFEFLHSQILSRGCAAEALAWTKAVMTRLGLTLNEAKTSGQKRKSRPCGGMSALPR